MKCVIQRVTHASVTVGHNTVGEIGPGLLALCAIQPHDAADTVARMAHRVLGYRMFADDAGKMNLSVADTGGGVLLVSQFTLAANTSKGMRPSFGSAAAPDVAKQLFDAFVSAVRARHADVATGEFGANMQVSLTNDGPVTFLLEN